MIFSSESLHNSIWGGNATAVCAYVLCMILFARCRRHNARLFLIFTVPMMAGVIVVYNPIAYSIFSKHIHQIDINAVYGRLFGLSLSFLGIVSGIVLYISCLKSKKQKLLSVIVLFLLLLSLYDYSSGYKPLDTMVDHYYKMTIDAKRIDDIIYDNPHILIIDDDNMEECLRTANKNQYYTYYDVLNMSEMYNSDFDSLHIEELDDERIVNEYPFVLCYDKKVCKKIQQMGYQLVWKDGKGNLYKKSSSDNTIIQK